MDWVSVSASGRYVVVSYDGDHPRVYDVNPTTLALTPRPMPDAAPRCSGGAAAQGFIYDLGHADLTLNPFDGNEDVLNHDNIAAGNPAMHAWLLKTLGSV